MDRDTIAALRELNRRFYERGADAFHQTRQQTWPGWAKVLGIVGERWSDSCPGSVLDVGCGNGRFLQALRQHWPGQFEYHGWDFSQALLELARQRFGDSKATWSQVDLFDLIAAGDHQHRYSCVLALAVLHHIPGEESRRQLLERLVDLVAAEGFLVVSFWKFLDSPRLRSKVLDETELSKSAAAPLVPHFESGDCLLRFADREELRYCHHVDEAEEQRLLQGFALPSVATFSADGQEGDLNRYHILGGRAL